MCGIAGILSFNGPVTEAEIRAFTRALAHRGPDAEGLFVDGAIALGHRRLAILDLSEQGNCPMSYGGVDGRRYWITYNGEVFNFLELRRELERLGHSFRSQTDTEVVLAAYAQWGADCLYRFNGMWAFAIWDSVERSLFVARDRFGIKPLYFCASTRFTFASELKAFLKLAGFTPRVNEELVPRVLHHPYSYEGTTDQTTMKGIQRLPGGFCLTITADGQGKARKWWETAEHLPEIPATYPEQVEAFRELLSDAVGIRMRSDVPIGTCLSGGLDSSSIACMMNAASCGNGAIERGATEWQHAFVSTFPGTVLDEKEYADQVVRHINAIPHYWTFDQDEAVAQVVDSVWIMEDVYGGIAVPVIGTYEQLRKNGVLVTLDGHGGDELLAGYAWYLDMLHGELNANLYQEFHYRTLPAILRNFDRCSMAHGVEVRMPLMDWRLVTFAFALDATAKLGGGFTKRILRDAVAGIVPERVRTRRQKIGFNSPMIEWFNGGMAPLITRVVNHRLWLDSPFFDGRRLRDGIVAKQWRGRGHWLTGSSHCRFGH